MPVPVQRDPELTRARLAGWLRDHLAARDVTVGPLTVPATAGFSAEILLGDATWTERGRTRTVPLAVRVAPAVHRIFPDLRWAEQVGMQTALARAGVPVAPVLGYEHDAGVLGAPFVVMSRVAGTVPADLPSYHREGWLADASPDRRRTMWLAALTAMSRVHRLDPQTVGASPAPSGDLDFYAGHLEFFGVSGDTDVLAALDWLRAHRPPAPASPRPLWGDARLGNIVFAGDRPAALLDWEMTDLGRPESDLAWFLHMDRFLSDGVGVPRLPGLPPQTETERWYAELLGRPLEHLAYHQVEAAFKFSVITARVVRLLELTGVMPPGSDFPLHRNATALLRRCLANPEWISPARV
ncbi:phosphotransferase family protein [Actinoplanes derwentensis]|uniref:Predicted kinase, aminoglycoside phosphotransferase (APT) family n=1 Tax=Actinoplanes derwentensis TaxID=113562 RepID=A0A1H2D8R8_9ACTN|nr:phosphotransferase family protein [Actinoplanes derwentensis]GID89717.1 putative phosphotransferase [Actinoplanes derwentensis]SDT78862.1 Predicted kinase, aminoglycoside phosphotransferase (APT) family [Actinoplanes derwentensis]